MKNSPNAQLKKKKKDNLHIGGTTKYKVIIQSVW